MQITVDTAELEQLARAVQDTTGQLGGLTVDLRKRVAAVDFVSVSRYGIETDSWLAEIESLAVGLLIDAAALEQLGLQVERLLTQAIAADGGDGLAALQAAMPDLWWFSMVARQAGAPTAAVAGGVAATPSTAAVQAIVEAAHELGVDPILALADATKETGHPGDVNSIDPSNTTGDRGTSIGIYQLHWGGELNQLGPTFEEAKAKALDPLTNARTALQQFAAVARAHPEYTPGQIAAAAQRPADPVAYAADVDRAYQMIKAAGIPPVVVAPPADASAPLASSVLASAQAWIGTPYLWGGGHTGGIVTPGAEEVDCSGLVRQVFGENGLSLSGTAATMYAQGAPVADLASAQPGDLLFWGTASNVHHVAIYIGNGKMIEAPHTGATVREINVYYGDFLGIRRVLP
jgi:cell wall-associated NlpC family hydrolase